MRVIGESCKQLKRIRVHIDSEDMTDYVTQKGMIAICEGCRELDFLVMYLADVDNEALAAVGRCLPKLTDFRIVLLEVKACPS
jgi:coronatine-insensitive protein 1